MSTFELAVIDIDDTLVGPDKTISFENRAAIRELYERGMTIMLASGRAARDMRPYWESLGYGGLMLSLQGALLMAPDTGKVEFERPVTVSLSNAIIRAGLRRGFTIFAYERETVWACGSDRWIEQFTSEGQLPPEIRDLNAGVTSGALKIIWSGPPEKINAFADDAAAMFEEAVATVVTYPWYLEFSAPGAHKGAGIAAAAEHLQIPREKVLAFGDGNNDVTMLRWAGLGVAMPEGQPAAKEAADLIGPESEPETALAKAIHCVLQGAELDGVCSR